MRRLLPVLLLLASPVARAADSFWNDPGRPYAIRFTAEAGALFVVANHLQSSRDGTYFDLRRDGGQNSAYFVQRYVAELDLGHSIVTVTYQPLELRTTSVLTSTFRYDRLDFPSGTALDVRYGFDFYRLSYLWNFASGPDEEVAIGASLQIRNASYDFSSADGALRRTSSGVGPFPLLKFRLRHGFQTGWWLQLEGDVTYVPGKIFNGSSSTIEAALWDVTARVGVRAGPVDPFLFARALGGFARGGDTPDGKFDDGYGKAQNSFLLLGLGVTFR